MIRLLRIISILPSLGNMVKPRFEQLAGADDEGSKLLRQRMQRFLIVIAEDQELRRPLAEQAAARSTDLAIGTAVESLPRHHEILYGESGDSYYFHSGTYYQAAEQGFQVVKAPVGIEVENLPSTAEMVAIDRQQYFVYMDTYYQAFFGGSGVVYKVVDDPNT